MVANGAQVNVRMDPDLKTAGDEALASIGFSPSGAVRALWRRAAERGEGLHKVQQLMNPMYVERSGEDCLDDAPRRGRGLFDEGVARLSLTRGTFGASVPADEVLRGEAMDELFGEGERP